jgi:hypothetical protein
MLNNALSGLPYRKPHNFCKSRRVGFRVFARGTINMRDLKTEELTHVYGAGGKGCGGNGGNGGSRGHGGSGSKKKHGSGSKKHGSGSKRHGSGSRKGSRCW